MKAEGGAPAPKKATSLLSRSVSDAMHSLDHRVGWHRLPRLAGVVTLIAIRNRLRERNLYDTGSIDPVADKDLGELNGQREVRTADGTFNDLQRPLVGSVGTRFGRNVPLEKTHPEPEPELLSPNPREVSRALLTRHEFKPATTLNVLAAAWLQFEVHDWFNHGVPSWDDPWRLHLAPGDPWHENPMVFPRAQADGSARGDADSPTWISHDSHWWDASQLYGHDEAFAKRLRAGEGGRIRVDPGGMLPKDLEAEQDLGDVAGNSWVGLALLHTLFSLEHNAICDRIRSEHPRWSDDQLYAHARLVNTALMAKIHTVEWTPAVIAHPTLRTGMRANWWGLAGQKVKRHYGRISDSEVISGIPGSAVRDHGVPYSLTEEFTAVYRMHPLLPDDFTFRSLETRGLMSHRSLLELSALYLRERLSEVGAADSLYSLGIAHPGAITLHNFPRMLQTLERPDGSILDLGAVDIMRIRERGVPRYNEFRRLFHMKPASSFEDLTPNPLWQREIREVYDDDLERVDLMVGLYGEPPPRGFGFSDTAFRVFVLMATRRLEADRFFTEDYRPEIYTQAGLDWIDDNTMVTVLLRHYPELAPVLGNVTNAFAPWPVLR